MIPISDTAVGVETEGELRTYAGNTAYTHIHLVNDITMTAGITIYAARASLVIDGEYPVGSGTRHQFTDMNSTSYYDTIGIGSASSITLTFKNMIINGRNYYGVPFITEAFNTNNVSVIYENVSYTGPQMTYNQNGLTRYIDCDITIQQTGVSAAQEVGEVNRVELGGRTTIVHRSLLFGENYSVFWFRGAVATMSLTILENAQINITSENCYFMYNMLPVLGTPYPLPYTIQTGASFNLTASRGISYDSRNQLTSFHVNANASFRYIQTASNGTAASLYINGELRVEQNARFYMQAANSAAPLIDFTSGTGRSLVVNNPFSFVLYCANNPALVSVATTQVSLIGGQLNTWSTPRTPITSAGGFDDEPEFKWHKYRYANPVVFTGTFSTNVTSATGNLTAEDAPYPAYTNLHLHSARVISIGDWPVTVNPVKDDGSAITGSIEAGANIRVIYTIAGVTHTLNGTAGADGRFTIETTGETPAEIPAGTEIEIWSNIPFLIKDTITTAIAAGDLEIVSAPDVIVFTIPAISTNPVLLPRTNWSEPVVIEDNLTDRTNWELVASITGPLQTEFGDVLTDGVVFRENAGASLMTLSGTPITVYVGGTAAGTIYVSWPRDAGILVNVTSPLRAGVKYSTRVNWELHTGN